jgi:uncharacterized membrane protein YkgB
VSGARGSDGMRRGAAGLATSATVHIDRRITLWMARNGPWLLRLSLGVVYLWFGALKFSNASPAEELATKTVAVLTFEAVGPGVSRPALATWECLIGLGLVSGRFLRLTLLLLFVQMMGTVTPLVLFPHRTWSRFPVPTLEGQYIIKNIVLVAAGIVVGGTVRGGGMIASGSVAERARAADADRARGVSRDEGPGG